MKLYRTSISLVCAALLLGGCQENQTSAGEDHHQQEEHGHGNHHEESEAVHLSEAQFEALALEVGASSHRNLNNSVPANGQLEVPPKHEAAVTAVVGANVVSIEIIEGDQVQKGQVLAYLSHPNLTQLQRDYLEAFNNLSYLEQEYQRQKRLYEAEVGSGQTFQKTTAEFRSAQAAEQSYRVQLEQLGMHPKRIQEGNFYRQVPVTSPIEGYITKVGVKTGQYVQPQTDLFEIVNVDHIHAVLMVFEKDIHQVAVGQTVRFTVESMPGEELSAEIYSVGKRFEQNPKAIHVHAELHQHEGNLIPGMYVEGQILTDSSTTTALPESAITQEGNDQLVFLAIDEGQEWMFQPIRVRTGYSDQGWVGVRFIDPVPEKAQFALNQAYYLLAELKKGEGGGHHH